MKKWNLLQLSLNLQSKIVLNLKLKFLSLTLVWSPRGWRLRRWRCRGGGGESVVFHFSGGKVKYGGIHGKEKHTRILFLLIYHQPLCNTSSSNHRWLTPPQQGEDSKKFHFLLHIWFWNLIGQNFIQSELSNSKQNLECPNSRMTSSFEVGYALFCSNAWGIVCSI